MTKAMARRLFATGVCALAVLAAGEGAAMDDPPSGSQAVTPSGRVTYPPPDTLSPAMREVYDDSVKTFGFPLGPRLPLLRSPELSEAWNALSKALSKSTLPRPLRELTILTVGATWQAEFEWYVHAKEAVRAGISPAIVEDIRVGRTPQFKKADERIVYDYAMELQRTHRVSDETYQAARSLLGDKTLAELTVLIGHYTMVSMTLNAHKAPLPPGVPPQF